MIYLIARGIAVVLIAFALFFLLRWAINEIMFARDIDTERGTYSWFLAPYQKKLKEKRDKTAMETSKKKEENEPQEQKE